MIKELLTSPEPLETETLKMLYGVTDEDMDKMHALQCLVHSTKFWEDSWVFSKIIRALNELEVNFVNFQGERVEHIWYGIDVANRIWPEKEYSLEVQKYVQWVSNEDGVFIYPPEMDDLPNIYYDGAVKLIKENAELKDRTVYEVQASKLLAIQLYIKNQKNK